jgi:hypothetical protein
MNISLSKILQMHWKGFPIRYMPLNISKYYIYCIGYLYFNINKKEKNNIIGVILNVLQR